MRQHLVKILAFCAACLVLGAQGQTSSTGSSSDPSGKDQRGSQDTSSSSTRVSATGRMGQQELRATKLVGAEVKSTSGEQLGTINDVILNPASGRIDFAVIALNPSSTSATSSSGLSSSTTSPSSTSSSTSPSSSTSSSSTLGTIASATGEKLVPVPWMLLRPAGATGYGSTSSSSTTSSSLVSSSMVSFVFTGDTTKLKGAPSFDQSNWPDISTYEWRHSIFSYYGISPGSATGGSFSPGGTSSGRSSSGSSLTPSTPPSSGSTSDSSSSTGKPQG